MFYYIPHSPLQEKYNVREFITHNITCVYGSVWEPTAFSPAKLGKKQQLNQLLWILNSAFHFQTVRLKAINILTSAWEELNVPANVHYTGKSRISFQCLCNMLFPQLLPTLAECPQIFGGCFAWSLAGLILHPQSWTLSNKALLEVKTCFVLIHPPLFV